MILAKQAVHFNPLEINSMVEPYLPFDAELQFTVKQNLSYFSDDPKATDIQRSIIINLVAVAQWLVKAIGFQDSVRMKYSQYAGKHVMMPTLRNNQSFESEENVAAYLEYPMPLDSLTYPIHSLPKLRQCINLVQGKQFCPSDLQSVAEHAQIFKGYYMKLLNYAELRANADFNLKGTQLHSYLSNRIFEVRFEDGSKFPLEPRTKDLLKDDYIDSPGDFLLKDDPSITSLKLQMKTLGTNSIFGPLTLKFFEEIGYSTRRKQWKPC